MLHTKLMKNVIKGKELKYNLREGSSTKFNQKNTFHELKNYGHNTCSNHSLFMIVQFRCLPSDGKIMKFLNRG